MSLYYKPLYHVNRRTYGARRIRGETKVRENARASSGKDQEQPGCQSLLLCAAARRDPPPLRLSPGDRRRAEVVGGTERPEPRPRGEALRGSRGGPPGGVR